MTYIIFIAGVLIGIWIISMLTSGKTEDLYNEIGRLREENKILRQ